MMATGSGRDWRAVGQVQWLNRVMTWSLTVLLSACAGLFVAMSAYSEDLRQTRLGAFTSALLGVHLLWRRRLFWSRELSIYVWFYVYMLLALLWTDDLELAMNTLVPATNFLIIAVLFGSLVRFHDARAVLFGALMGFGCAAAFYTITQGFPFSFPADFSYNAVAGMYLFGLILTLMLSCFARTLLPWLAVEGIIMVHIVATTSIKTNLGIVLGLFASMLMYWRHYGRVLRRRSLVVAAVLLALPLAIGSSGSMLETMQRGAQRVMLGIEVLEAREDLPGYSSFAERGNWGKVGIEGWKQDPVFGHGTEAFRAAYGITSHSTPVDLLYNFGVIGLLLFYGVFASMAWRLMQLGKARESNWRSLIVGFLVCYSFVSLSGTIHYNAFLAAFVGISTAMLVPRRVPGAGAPYAARTG